MPWVFLLLAVVALAAAFRTTSMLLAMLCLLAALALLLAGALGLLARRVGSRSRDEALLLDPQVLRRLREQAEARRSADTTIEPPMGDRG